MFGPARIDGVIASRRIVILEAFVSQVRLVGFASSRTPPAEIVRPADACITALARSFGSDAPESDRTHIGNEYAEQRHRLGYDLRALLTEIGILRSTIVEVMTAQTGQTAGDTVERIAQFFHDLTIAAGVRFTTLGGRISPSSRPPLRVITR